MNFVEFLLSLDTLSTVTTAIVVSAFYLLLQRWFESRTLPPGPWGLPFIGYGLFIDPAPYKSFCKLSKKYGDIFSFRLGQRLTVVINNYETIHKLFTNYGETFHGKPQFFTINSWIANYAGVIFEDGPVWKAQRRFLLSALRDFGLGKGAMARKIINEAEMVVEVFRNNKQPFDPRVTFSNCASNIISALVFDTQLPYDDPHFLRLRSALDATKFPLRIRLIVNFPWLRFLPFSSLTGWNLLLKSKNMLHKYINEEIQRHRDTFDENNLRDVIDVYILEAKKAGEHSWMTDKRLFGNILSLYTAGQETISLTLYWGIKLMAMYPDIQEKIQKELDTVIGEARMPEWSDRTKMPFTEATIFEIQRYSCILPINVEHSTLEEVTVNGFTIPKNTTILANLYSALFQDKYWKNPQEFDPNNFLDEEGKFINNEAFIPFSIGKRACLGESLARMELFLFFTSLLQRFIFLPPEGEMLAIEEPLTPFGGKFPGDYKIRAIPRF